MKRKSEFRGLKTLDRLVKTISAPLLMNHPLSRLFLDWELVVGTAYAQEIWPLKMVPLPGGTSYTLHIATASPSMEMVLHYQKNFLMQQINQFFGRPLVGQLAFKPGLRHAPKTPKARVVSSQMQSQIKAMTQDIPDDQLRESLEKWGITLAQYR